MALNFTQRSVFPMEFSSSCTSVVEPGQLDTDMHGLIREADNVYDEILRVLPADPFGMDATTATFNAFSEWLERFEVENSSNLEGSILDITWENLDSYFSSAVCLSTYPSTSIFYGESYDECCSSFSQETHTGSPHEAIFFSIGYLGVADLLSVERVCRSLNIAVKGDPLLWKNIHIDKPLSERLTDDVLCELTSRSQGNLTSLTIVESLRITDYGIRHVFQSNPKLKKLVVPGCVRLTINGVLGNIRALKAAGRPGIKYLRVSGISGVMTDNFDELILLLGAEASELRPMAGLPCYYHTMKARCLVEDDSVLDIERCPSCGEVRMVYDCPTDGCRAEGHLDRPCRGCITCIARCSKCGRCIKDRSYEETFFLDLLCLDCQVDSPLCG